MNKQPNSRRLALVIGAVMVWSLVILLRLGNLQILRHKELAEEAGRNILRPLTAPRGVIYDSRMNELASSIQVQTVIAEPRRITDKLEASRRLASILGLDTDELHRRMQNPARAKYLVVQRRIDPNDEQRVEALGIPGVWLEEDNLRVYPNRNLACHVLGFVNMNADGGAGLELQYDKELKGSPGTMSFSVDALGKSFRGTVRRAATAGHSFVLSLDKSIQYVAERELLAGIQKSRAAAGVVLAMESDSGRILALANYPDFNSNKYNAYPLSVHLNRAVSLFFEPGSTFKVVVAAAALESGLADPEELIDCGEGSIEIGGHLFRDHRPYGLLTFNQILERSSNVGAAVLGLRLGEEQLYRALKLFGFGERTGVDLPGEIVGLVRPLERWSKLSIGALSFGHEIGVTPLQILTAVNSIANGGYRVRPSVVDRVIDHRGNLVRRNLPQRERIISEQTAFTIRDAFEGVVLRGTGTAATLEGYRAGGKTGTSQKVVNGRYSHSKYVASFVGFAPLPEAKITVMVMLDEPKGAIYGGDVAAPVFKKITEELLMMLRVQPANPTNDSKPRFDPTLAAVSSEDFLPNAWAPTTSAAASKETPATTEDIVVLQTAKEHVFVPDFRGLSKRQVIQQCAELGIHMQASGSGLAVFQAPVAGNKIPIGRSCAVTFSNEFRVERLAHGAERPEGQAEARPRVH